MIGIGTGIANPFLWDAKWRPSGLYYGAQGFAFDPSRLWTLFQDSAGTIPVTAAGQPVGRVLDISGRGNHALQSISAARPNYEIDSGGRPYLLTDGSSDHLNIASFAMGAAGRTVISAIRKNSDAALGSVVEHRPAWTTSGGIAHFAPGANGAATYGSRWQSSAVQSILSSPASYAAPHTAVVTSIAQTGSHVLRVNGSQVASDAPAGAMAALTAGMTIGMRDGASLPASMRLYAMLVIDRALSAAELAAAEKWAAARAGVTLP